MTEKKETSKKDEIKKLCWWQNPMIRFSFFLVIFTFCLVVVGVLQWRTLKDTNLTSQLRDRAFINFSNPTVKV